VKDFYILDFDFFFFFCYDFGHMKLGYPLQRWIKSLVITPLYNVSNPTKQDKKIKNNLIEEFSLFSIFKHEIILDHFINCYKTKPNDTQEEI